jgi:Glyoxalase-like domain
VVSGNGRRSAFARVFRWRAGHNAGGRRLTRRRRRTGCTLDLRPADRTREQETERILALGASLLADHRRPDGSGWITLADPEGNEFCILSGNRPALEPRPDGHTSPRPEAEVDVQRRGAGRVLPAKQATATAGAGSGGEVARSGEGPAATTRLGCRMCVRIRHRLVAELLAGHRIPALTGVGQPVTCLQSRIPLLCGPLRMTRITGWT